MEKTFNVVASEEVQKTLDDKFGKDKIDILGEFFYPEDYGMRCYIEPQAGNTSKYPFVEEFIKEIFGDNLLIDVFL